MKKSVKFWTAIVTGAAMVLSLSCGALFSNSEVTVFADEGEEGGGEELPDYGDQSNVVPVPVLTGNPVYNGEEHYIVDYLNWNEGISDISGETSGYNARTYTVEFALKVGYVWSDPAFDGLFVWEIQKAKLELAWDSSVYYYTGETYSPRPKAIGELAELVNLNDLVLTGALNRSDCGEYEIDVSIEPESFLDKNFYLADDAKIFNWTIINENGEGGNENEEGGNEGGNENENEKPLGTFTVTFNSNGGSRVASQAVLENGKVIKPEDPERNGYTFVGWFKDAKYVTPFNFAHDVVTADTTLYAYWFKNEEKSDDDLLTLMGCNSSVSASLAVVGGMLAVGISAFVIKKKLNKK